MKWATSYTAGIVAKTCNPGLKKSRKVWATQQDTYENKQQKVKSSWIFKFMSAVYVTIWQFLRE